MDLALRLKLLQSRKDGVDLYYTTQRAIAVETTLRHITNVFYKCKTLNFKLFRLFAAIEVDLASDGNVNEDDTQMVYWYLGKRKLYNAYDTSQKVFPDSVKRQINVDIPLHSAAIT
jgi:hypothetical protein